MGTWLGGHLRLQRSHSTRIEQIVLVLKSLIMLLEMEQRKRDRKQNYMFKIFLNKIL